MLIRNLKSYIDAVVDYGEFGVVVHSIETGKEIAVSFDVVADINEYGQLMIGIAIEQNYCGRGFCIGCSC